MNTHIISGSHRTNSQSAKVAKFIASKIEAKGGKAGITELAHNALPLWDEGVWEGAEKWKKIWSPIESKLKAADSLVIISPEYSGMAAPALKNFFLFCGGDVLGHKPALLVGVSSGRGGGSYPIQELRGSSYKNTRILYIPDHVIVRESERVLNSPTPNEGLDEFYHKQLDYSLAVLGQYEAAMKSVRLSPVINYKDFPSGM